MHTQPLRKPQAWCHPATAGPGGVCGRMCSHCLRSLHVRCPQLISSGTSIYIHQLKRGTLQRGWSDSIHATSGSDWEHCVGPHWHHDVSANPFCPYQQALKHVPTVALTLGRTAARATSSSKPTLRGCPVRDESMALKSGCKPQQISSVGFPRGRHWMSATQGLHS